MTLGNRMSSLPTAEFCGRAQEYDLGAGRAAAMSTAFHAQCSGKLTDEAMARISQAEQEEIATWKKPEPWLYRIHGTAVQLGYDDAVVELEVGLDEWGAYVEADSPECVSVGHLDMAWLVSGEFDGTMMRIGIVGDIKRSEWTSEPESLQLHAYATAWARKNGCNYYLTAIWAAKEGGWTFGDIVALDSPQQKRLWGRLQHAITNVGGEHATGPHCFGCWSRLRCPAFLFPKEAEGTDYEVVNKGDDATDEEVARLLLRAKADEEKAEQARDFAKVLASRRGGIRWEGKVFRSLRMAGRESVSPASLRKQMGPEAEAFIQKGKDYEIYKWVKA